ncbi:hypothetical protein [Natrialba taiwanensis]|uniref:Uncharacterized protein n=1 Tax=Natrialba taiwanensis DSM 12281 TaxID=1230458 RepID=M0ABP4_9EURY|nr:hypothetical protein [Natrialba taiwanensis]ELY95949.1 hypothetical protein C484_03129 [Natrialba taiwanensis DSM 12281]
MARDDPVSQDTSVQSAEQFPNLVTIVGRGVPSTFEIAVDGEIEMLADDPVAEATIVSEKVAEGTIDVGVQRFRFAGEMANIHVVDWNGVPASESPNTPTVHVEYGSPER